MDNEAWAVQLNGIEKLLEKIDKNQESQWKEITRHGNEIIGIKGELVTLNETNSIRLRNREESEIRLEESLKNLKGSTEKHFDQLKETVGKNTKFRQNLEGFSWIRHGLPFAAILIGLVSLIASLWPKG